MNLGSSAVVSWAASAPADGTDHDHQTPAGDHLPPGLVRRPQQQHLAAAGASDERARAATKAAVASTVPQEDDPGHGDPDPPAVEVQGHLGGDTAATSSTTASP